MAKQASFLKFTGRMGNISFYKMNGIYYSREADGPSRNRIRNSPYFQGTRNQLTEFHKCSASGKNLRVPLTHHFKSNDKYYYRRMTSQFTKLLMYDQTNPRGSRSPLAALQNSDGRDFLKGFSFNLAQTPSILINEINFSANDQLEIRDLVVLKRLFPKGAHTAEIKAGVLIVDLSSTLYQFVEYSHTSLKHNDLAPVLLAPQNEVVSNNPRFYVMQIKLFDKHGEPFRQAKSDLLFIIKVRWDKPAPAPKGVIVEFPESVSDKRRIPSELVFTGGLPGTISRSSPQLYLPSLIYRPTRISLKNQKDIPAPS